MDANVRGLSFTIRFVRTAEGDILENNLSKLNNNFAIYLSNNECFREPCLSCFAEDSIDSDCTFLQEGID